MKLLIKVFIDAAKVLYNDHLKYKERSSRTTSIASNSSTLNKSIAPQNQNINLNEAELKFNITKKDSNCKC